MLQVLNRWATPVNQLRSQTHRALRNYLKDTTISYSSHFGALSAMIALGPDVLEDCLLPQLESYIEDTKEKMQNADEEDLAAAASFNRRDAGFYDNQKKKAVLNLMWGTLVVAARSILTYYTNNFQTLIHSNKYISDQAYPSNIKAENGECAESAHGDPNKAINLLEVYELLNEHFGSSLAMIDADWCRVVRCNKSKAMYAKSRYYSTYKRAGAHRIGNPLENVGRMRIRTLGKKRKRSGDEMLQGNLHSLLPSLSFVKKEEVDESMDYKLYGEDNRNLSHPRPTSSTSSDAEFNYLAGCGLPTDIFEPSNVSNSTFPYQGALSEANSNIQNIGAIKIEPKEPHNELHLNEDSVFLSPSVVQNFDVERNAQNLGISHRQNHGGIKSVIRRQNITFDFGPTQWPKKRLRRKHLTASVACRYNSLTSAAGSPMHFAGKNGIVVGKRMGTPRGITSNFATVENSCSLLTFI